MSGMTELPAAANAEGRRPLGWFANPYTQLAVGAVLSTASELLLKRGASSAPAAGGAASVVGVTALLSGWTWVGIALYVLATFSWLHVLRLLPLGIAFGLSNVVHVLVPLAAWLFLHETISSRRWLGIALLLAGLVALARPTAAAEEAL
jgi:undecaprenyl phosphate-alpha-L-ara4N flippase subunit ArnE